MMEYHAFYLSSGLGEHQLTEAAKVYTKNLVPQTIQTIFPNPEHKPGQYRF